MAVRIGQSMGGKILRQLPKVLRGNSISPHSSMQRVIQIMEEAKYEVTKLGKGEGEWCKVFLLLKSGWVTLDGMGWDRLVGTSDVS